MNTRRVRVKVVIITQSGDNTGIHDGEVQFGDAQMRFALDGRQVACPYDGVERIAQDESPAGFGEYFEEGLVIQWSNGENRLRAVIDVQSGSANDFLSRVCERALSDQNVRVEQTITPFTVTAETDIESRAGEAPIVIDTEANALTFEAGELQSIRPEFVTSVEQGKKEINGVQYDAVMVRTLTSDDFVETTLFLRNERHVLLHDYVVTASRLSETGGPIRVLLVDDEPGLTRVGKLQLNDTHEGLSIDSATSTQGALDLLQDTDYECIITDYEMPDGGAPAIIERNRQQEIPSDVIIYSRNDREKIPEEEIPVGIDLWITKSAEMDQYHRLGTAIKRLVASRRSKQNAT